MKMGRRTARKKLKTENKIDQHSNNQQHNLVCSVCHNAFASETIASKHILNEHYNLARINDDSPFTENETIKAFINAQKALKVLRCKNVGCGKKFKSGLGYKLHLSSCGKSDEETNVDCEVCGKKLKIGSLAGHMKLHQVKENDVNNHSENQKEQENEVGPKRKSALRAQKVFESLINEDKNVEHKEQNNKRKKKVDEMNETDEHEESEKKKSDDEKKIQAICEIWDKFIYNPYNFLRKPPEENNWNEEIKKKGKIKCPVEDCTNTFNSKPALVYHYKRCGIKCRWSCQLCNYETLIANQTTDFKALFLVIKHLNSTHDSEMPSLSSELKDYLNFSNIDLAFKSDLVQKNSNLEAISLLFKFSEKYYKETPFMDWLPNKEDWIPLIEKEKDLYKFGVNRSPKLKIKGAFRGWKELKNFESISYENNITFFVGGPVRSCAWCPLPFNVNNFSQFIAIATCLNMDTHRLTDIEPEKGLLQIWDCGKLERQYSEEIHPKLSLCMAHEYGTIWDMDWCPNGSFWTNNDQHNCVRLGLLALACGDGYVRIHSIPNPKLFNNQNTNGLTCKNKAVAILQPPDLRPTNSFDKTICKCLSWLKSNNQSLIAAGYGNGIIAVWDLLNLSKLLVIKKNEHQLCLRPKLSWNAHTTSVNKVRWTYNSSKNFLASCSLDRSAKIWDLNDLVVPIKVFKRGVFTSIDTHIQWCGLFTACDDCHFNFNNYVTFKDFANTDYHPNNLNSHRSCVWDISFSEWLNTSASVDAAGEAVIFVDFKSRSETKERNKITSKFPVYNVSLELIKDVPRIESNLKTNSKDFEQLLDKNIPPFRSYEEAVENCGIVYNDIKLNDMKNLSKEELKEQERIRLANNMHYQRLSDFPVVSLSNVKWNCNFGSCTWLFTASQIGVCRLSCISYLDPTIR